MTRRINKYYRNNETRRCRLMTDLYTKKRRSEIMSGINSKDTAPEIKVRKALHRLGFRFRLHRKDLPGKPDIVLPKWKTVVLVHGCFWHCHNCCEGHVPKSNKEYWTPKLQRNVQRDEANAEKLRLLGWRRIVIWECETGNLQKLERKLRGEFRRIQRETGVGTRKLSSESK